MSGDGPGHRTSGGARANDPRRQDVRGRYGGPNDRTTDKESGDLRRSLGSRDLVVYGLLFFAPMAPVGVYGTLDARSHGAVALVYLVATVAMAFTAFSYAQMVRVVPQAGSVFAYARVALGREAGRPGSSPAGWRCWTIC